MWLQLDGALAHFNILFISRKIKYTSLNVLNKYFAYFANVCQWIYLLPCLSSFFVIKLSKDDLLGRKRRRSSLTSTPLPPRSSPPFLWKRIEPYQRWSSSLAWDFSPISLALVSRHNALWATSSTTMCMDVRSMMTSKAAVGHVLIAAVMQTHVNRCSWS